MEKEIDQLVSDLMKKDENFEVVSLWGWKESEGTWLKDAKVYHLLYQHSEEFLKANIC